MAKYNHTSLLSPSRIAFYLLSIPVFFLALKYIGNFYNIKVLLLQIKLRWLLVAVVLQVSTYVLNAQIIKALLVQNPAMLSFLTLVKMSVVIVFINQALPTGGLSGNGYLFKQLVKRQVPVEKAFSLLILQLICYYIAFLMLLSSAYACYLFDNKNTPAEIRITAFIGYGFFFFLFGVMILISNSRLITLVLSRLCRLGRLGRYLGRKALALPRRYHGSFKEVVTDKKLLLKGISLQMLLLICDIFTADALLEGFQVQMPFIAVFFAVLLSIVIGSLPLSPGSLITYESGMMFFLHLLGCPIHAALVVTLLFRFFTFWLPMPIGFFWYGRLRVYKSIGKVAHANGS